jgi:hypothetical protein
MSVDEAYKRWLFQGPAFQGIASIEGIGEAGMVATLVPSSPQRCLRAPAQGEWLVDPVVMDSAFQLAILWARVHTDMTPLPAGFQSFRLFAPLVGSRLRADFRARASAGGHVLDTQVTFMDPDGRILARLEDMQFNCSRALNRLAGRGVLEATQ